jgi:hypothetical protein
MRPYKVDKRYLNLYTNTVQNEVPKVTKIPDKLPQNRYSNTQKAGPVIIEYLRAVFVNKRYLWAGLVKCRTNFAVTLR